MDIQEAIRYLEESKCEQNRGEAYQEIHNNVLKLAIKALEEKYFFENEVSHIHEWFVENKDCLLDSAMSVSRDWFNDCNVGGAIYKVGLDFMIEDIVDEIQKGILNVLSTCMDKHDEERSN